MVYYPFHRKPVCLQRGSLQIKPYVYDLDIKLIVYIKLNGEKLI